NHEGEGAALRAVAARDGGVDATETGPYNEVVTIGRACVTRGGRYGSVPAHPSTVHRHRRPGRLRPQAAARDGAQHRRSHASIQAVDQPSQRGRAEPGAEASGTHGAVRSSGEPRTLFRLRGQRGEPLGTYRSSAPNRPTSQLPAVAGSAG